MNRRLGLQSSIVIGKSFGIAQLTQQDAFSLSRQCCGDGSKRLRCSRGVVQIDHQPRRQNIRMISGIKNATVIRFRSNPT